MIFFRLSSPQANKPLTSRWKTAKLAIVSAFGKKPVIGILGGIMSDGRRCYLAQQGQEPLRKALEELMGPVTPKKETLSESLGNLFVDS